MGWWAAVGRQVREMFGAPVILQTAPAHRYESGPVDALMRGILGNSTWVNAGPVSRDEALSISAVTRGRDQICAIATLPLVNYRGSDIIPAPFLDQPDPDVARVVMLAQTLEDLLCDGISWWIKTAIDYRQYPLTARRCAPGSVSLTPPASERTRTPAPLPSGDTDPRGALVWVDGHPVPATRMIRFDSPNPGMLKRGARTIRRALLLDALAAMYADNPRPLETFTDSADQTVTTFTDDEVDAFLSAYRMMRKRGGPAWIPGQVQRLDVSAPSPSELQLVELQKQVALELANLMGLDAEEVGVSTTSRSYFNGTDRDRQKINNTLAPYMSAIADRLSMGDITPRGQRVRFDLTDYLKPDPAAQVSYWEGLVRMGAMDRDEVRAAAGLPARAASTADALTAAAAAVSPAIAAHLAAASRAPLAIGAATFAGDGSGMTFSVREFASDTPAEPARADVEKRTITGLALPYGAVARKYGVGFRFKPGSLEYDSGNIGRLKAMDGHATFVGVHKDVEDTKAGPVVTLAILDGPEGSPAKLARDQLLHDAAGGLADGLSVGVDFSLDPADGDVEWNETEQLYDVNRATWHETSVTPMPAFTDARVTKVAASRTGGLMFCQHCGRQHPAGVACATFAALSPATPPAAPAATIPPAGTAPRAYSAAELTAALEQLVSGMAPAAAPPAAAAAPGDFATVVNPTALPIPGAPATAGAAAGQMFGNVQVNEPAPYHLQYDRRGEMVVRPGSHDFSTDLHAWFSSGDTTAHDRALSFVRGYFDVSTTDAGALNPTRTRPDLYVDQRTYRYPMWDAISKGALSDITPFTFPKWNSAAGLVAAHTEGVEPGSGTFTVTSQTVTPTGYSGKAKIHREVWDQGGNPQVSTLIWNQMVKGVNEALEAAAVSLLNAGAFPALGALTAGNADQGRTLAGEIEAGMAALQFVRGGYAFTDAFAQADLYLALAAAKTDTGEPLYPMIGASNRNGQSAARFGVLEVAGQPFYPAWALAAAGQVAAVKSYLIDRASVHGWASAPQRLTFETEVANIYLGVWGYQATAVSDANGVRTIAWDPAA